MSFLPEAILMAEYCDDRPGNIIADLDFLDAHPQYRIALECLVQSPNGNLFDEQENHAGGDSLPVHLRMERRFYLNKTKDFNGVQALLEAMTGLYREPGHTASQGIKDVRRLFLKRCEKLGDAALGLESITEYFTKLVNELPELDNDDGMTLCLKGEFWSSITYSDGGDATGFIMHADVSEDEGYVGCGPITRQVLVHTPYGDLQKDWIQRQPIKWQNLYFDMRKCVKLESLPAFNAVIRKKTEEKVYKGGQLRVLWDMYFIKRDYLREKMKQRASLNMGECAIKLIASIERQVDRVHMARKVGPCLHAWSHGEEFMKMTLPGQMTKAEWSVVWDVYKQKKEAL